MRDYIYLICRLDWTRSFVFVSCQFSKSNPFSDVLQQPNIRGEVIGGATSCPGGEKDDGFGKCKPTFKTGGNNTEDGEIPPEDDTTPSKGIYTQKEYILSK